MSKTNKLSIYLVKDGINDENAIIKKIGRKVELQNIGTFYLEASFIKEPSWVEDFFVHKLGDNLNLTVSSAKGVLLVKISIESKEVRFILSFGTGRHMIKEGVIEERFGLKTTLNTVKPGSLRSIEKNSLGVGAKISKEQMSKASKASDFGIDIEQDLLRAVTGSSKSGIFGNIISGADSLSVSTKVDIDNILEFLTKCYERYISQDYQEEFGWIDQIQEIKDGVLIESLNSLLLDKLNAKDFGKIWMAIPDLIEWSDLKGFKAIPRQKELTDDINISDFVNSFNKNEGIENIGQLKNRTITAFSASTDSEVDSWTSFRCIYGELEKDNKQFIINNGKWYEVESNFVKTINKIYSEIRLSDIILPKYDHLDEADYNKKITEENSNFLLMDRNNIFHGGGHNQIEFCDILDKKNKIIHIKHYGGSAVLSHLFQQGLISGELFVSDPEFRKKLNKKLKSGWKLNDSSQKIIPSDYEIVFAIISNGMEERPNIPFFSKVSIKNVTRRLEGFGYRVTLKRIQSVKSNEVISDTE
jgi:uncharacterized protein (TIGR04141 family)